MRTSAGMTAEPRSGSTRCSCTIARGFDARSYLRSSGWWPHTRTCYGRHGMSFSPTELGQALAQSVQLTRDTLVVELTDGRTLSVPISWYPRLAHGTPAEQAEWQL